MRPHAADYAMYAIGMTASAITNQGTWMEPGVLVRSDKNKSIEDGMRHYLSMAELPYSFATDTINAIRAIDPVCADIMVEKRSEYTLAQARRIMECVLINDYIVAFSTAAAPLSMHWKGSLLTRLVSELNHINRFVEMSFDTSGGTRLCAITGIRTKVCPDVGICANIMLDDSTQLVSVLSLGWCDHSGEFNYPVYDPAAGESAETQYRLITKWTADTAYGRQRVKLLNHLTAVADAILKEARLIYHGEHA